MLSALVLVSISAVSFAMEVTEDRAAQDRVATSRKADQQVADAEKLAKNLRKYKPIFSQALRKNKDVLEIQEQIIKLRMQENELQREVTGCIDSQLVERIAEIQNVRARISQKKREAEALEASESSAVAMTKASGIDYAKYHLQYEMEHRKRRSAAEWLLQDDSRKIENTSANGMHSSRTAIVTEEFEAETMSGNHIRKLHFGQVGIIRVADDVHMLEIVRETSDADNTQGAVVHEKELVRVPDDCLDKLRYVLPVPKQEPEVNPALVQPQPKHYNPTQTNVLVAPSTPERCCTPPRKNPDHTWRSPASQQPSPESRIRSQSWNYSPESRITSESRISRSCGQASDLMFRFYPGSEGSPDCHQSSGEHHSPGQQSLGEPSSKRVKRRCDALPNWPLQDMEMLGIQSTRNSLKLTVGDERSKDEVFRPRKVPTQQANPEQETVEHEKAEAVEQETKPRRYSH